MWSFFGGFWEVFEILVLGKNHLLFLVENPAKYSDLIGKLHSLKNTSVNRIRNMGFEQLKNFLIKYRNCVVVLLIERKRGEAVELLYRMHSCLLSPPYLVVISKLRPGRLLNHINSNSVCKFFDLNSSDYSAGSVASWIQSIYRGLSISSVFPCFERYSRSYIRNSISVRLNNMGMFFRLTGHKYVVDAIELCVYNPDIYMTKNVYWILARRYGATYASVDRCMRHAIEVVWRDTAIDCLEKYYPDADRVYKIRPSVSEFVRCMASDISERIFAANKNFDNYLEIS